VMGRVSVLWWWQRAGVGESPDLKQAVKRTPEVAVEAGATPVCRLARFYTVIKAVFCENGLRGSAHVCRSIKVVPRALRPLKDEGLNLFWRELLMIKAAVLGATGYTGVELVRLLNGHPGADPVFLSSGSSAGKSYSEVHPQFYGQVDLKLQQMKADQIPEDIDIVFCALPHGKSAPVVSELLDSGYKIIDLSADFRLLDKALYLTWYNLVHPAVNLLGRAVYGLPELYSAEISGSSFIANPGCYPTSILLALAPLLREKAIKTGSIIIDSKSGVSGAGRSPKQAFHFPDCTENFKAYRVASHQHTAEIEQELGRIAGENLKVTFTPHLVPMVRGILSTIYCEPGGDINEKVLLELYEDFYKNCPFVRVLSGVMLPETRMVRGTNFCDLALKYDERTNRVILISAIDNLVKGASGQAVQNMNVMLGLPQEAGLGQLAL